MRLSKTEQERMKCEVYNEFATAYNGGRFHGWSVFVDFDRHSPCQNILLTTLNGSEIKVFLPNSTGYDEYNEEYNEISVWFNVYGEGEDESPEYFADEQVLIDYLLENEKNL